MSARETAVFKAQLAKIAHRYEDMAEAMKSVALMDEELTLEEGNLLTLGYKNMIASRRSSSTILSSTEYYKYGGRYASLNVDYNRKVEKELSRICDDLCSILDEHVIPASNSAEDQVYYYKMIGDTYAYRAGAYRFMAATKSAFVYETATTIAELELCGSDPIRLALALNYAVMYYNVFNKPEVAFNIAYKALEECFGDETIFDRETTAKSLEIRKILLNHLILWHLYMIENEAQANAGNDNGKANVAAKHTNGKANAANDNGKANVAKHTNGEANAGNDNGKANVAKHTNGKANVAKHWYGKANVAKHTNGIANAENDNGKANVAEYHINGEANAENNNGEANAENNNGGAGAE